MQINFISFSSRNFSVVARNRCNIITLISDSDIYDLFREIFSFITSSLTDGIIAPGASTTLGGLRSSHMLHFQIHGSGSKPGCHTRSVIRRGPFHREASSRQGSRIEGCLLFGAIRLFGHFIARWFFRVFDCNSIGFIIIYSYTAISLIVLNNITFEFLNNINSILII